MLRGWRWLVVIVALIGLALALQAGLVAFAGYVLLGVYLLSRYLAAVFPPLPSPEVYRPVEDV